MKISKYALFTELKNEKYIYHSLSGAMLKLDSTSESKFQKCFKNAECCNSVFTTTEAELLRKCSILVDDNVDEYEEFVQLRSKAIEKDEVLRITIAPTLACNFRCPYCFEEHKQGVMDKHIQSMLLRYVDEKLQKGKYSKLCVTWFGGEPLLCYDIILSLSRELLNICEKYNINYSAGMVTNGYLLKEVDCDKLVDECLIKMFQITIDGPRKEHNKRRYLANKLEKETYDTIIEGINKISEKECLVKVRINLDVYNQSMLHEMVQELDANIENKKKVSPYLAKIFCMEDLNEDFGNPLLESGLYIDSVISFINKIKEVGFNVNPKVVPKVKRWFCAAPYGNSIVIDPIGDLFYCWNDIGIRKYRVGSLVEEDTDEYKNRRNMWYKYGTEDHEVCISCKSLMLCGGGCVREKIRAAKEYTCNDYALYIEKFLKNYLEHDRRGKENGASD